MSAHLNDVVDSGALNCALHPQASRSGCGFNSLRGFDGHLLHQSSTGNVAQVGPTEMHTCLSAKTRRHACVPTKPWTPKACLHAPHKVRKAELLKDYIQNSSLASDIPHTTTERRQLKPLKGFERKDSFFGPGWHGRGRSSAAWLELSSCSDPWVLADVPHT